MSTQSETTNINLNELISDFSEKIEEQIEINKDVSNIYIDNVLSHFQKIEKSIEIANSLDNPELVSRKNKINALLNFLIKIHTNEQGDELTQEISSYKKSLEDIIAQIDTLENKNWFGLSNGALAIGAIAIICTNIIVLILGMFFQPGIMAFFLLEASILMLMYPLTKKMKKKKQNELDWAKNRKNQKVHDLKSIIFYKILNLNTFIKEISPAEMKIVTEHYVPGDKEYKRGAIIQIIRNLKSTNEYDLFDWITNNELKEKILQIKSVNERYKSLIERSMIEKYEKEFTTKDKRRK